MAFRLSFFAFLISLAGSALAGDLPVITQEPRIPQGQSRSFEFGFEFGNVAQKDTTVLLDVVARLDSDSFGGSLYFMKLILNGRVVQAAKTRTAVRLQNRGLVSPVAPNLPYSWFRGGAWRVLYAPDFKGALEFGFYEGNPYQTVLDVTDLISPAAENRLEIINTCAYPVPVGSKANHDLVIKALVIRSKPGASLMLVGAATDQDVINRGTPGAGPARYKGNLRPGGGFVLTTGKRRLEFNSAISYPNAGLNKLTPTDKPHITGQMGFSIQVKPTADGGQVIGEGPDYRLRRTVRFTPRKVEVADEITNLHGDAKLGLLVANQVSLKGHQAAVRLAGNPDPAINEYYSPANPSVYVRLKALGLGLICEDDVLRNQATLFYGTEAQAAGLRTEMLCLPAGGSYTLRWSVYPVASEDYYDFINLVRQDWGANYPVEGAWTFFTPDQIIPMPVEKIREQFNRLGIKHACSWGGWVDAKHDPKKIGFGTGILGTYWADYRDRLRQAAIKIREAVPDCKVLVYYDTQRDTSDGGHERFQDSWLTDPGGNQLSTEWGGMYSLTYSMVATLTNNFGKGMLNVVDEYFKQMQVDGLYWDEMEGVGYGAPLITYKTPDGYSCLLDRKTYTIRREIGITTILGEGHRLAVIDRVQARSGTLMGNGPACTRKLLGKQVQRMVEIQHNEYWNYEGNLGTPLGYASTRLDFGNWTRSLKMATLLVGTRWDYEHEISPYVFPLTPIELHAGYLLGQERIITIHSGNYGWPGESCLVQVRHLNEKEKLTTTDFPTKADKESRTRVHLAEGQAAVLERLPATVKPKAGQAMISQVKYGPEGLSLMLTAPGGAALRVGSGAMKVAAGQKLVVSIGDETQTVRAAGDGFLTVEVEAGTKTKVTVRPLG